VRSSITPLARTAVKNFLIRSFDVSPDEAAGFIPDEISQWGKIGFLNGGDTIRAAELVQQSERNMMRDASFLKVTSPPLTSNTSLTIYQYSHDVDKNRNNRRMPVHLERKTAYRQLLRIVEFTAPPRRLLLAIIHPVGLSYYASNPDTPYYQDGKFKPLEVIDIDDISCLVARIPDHQPGPRRWALWERPDAMGAGDSDET
jgi:hypothetical protein